MLSLFRLLTGGGQRVLSMPDEGRLVHALPGQGGAADVLALRSTSLDRHCFLLDGGTGTALLRCGHPMHRALALPMRVHVRATDSVVSLVYPVNRKYLCARPAAPGEQFGTVWADHDDPGPGRMFTLEALPSGAAPPAARALAAAVEALFVERHDAAGLLQRLDGMEPQAASAALEAILPALTTPQLDRLAQALLGAPERIAMLAGMLRPDVWAQQGLPQLAAWLARRGSPASASTSSSSQAASLLPTWRRLIGLGGSAKDKRALSSTASDRAPLDARSTPRAVLGAQYDQAALPHWRNGFVSSAHELGAALRRGIEPRRTVCLVAPARNEGIYLLEWIAYHRALGVEAFFLYTNDNQDGSDVLLDALSRAGVITWFDNQVQPQGSALGKCYGHALSILPELLDYRWAIFIDLDEFVVVDPTIFASLGDYIDWQELQDVDAIALNWMFMRSSNRGALDGPLTERCRWQSAEFDSHVKSLCRPRRVVQATSHFPLGGERRSVVLRSASGGLHRPSTRSNLDSFEAPSRSECPDGAMAWVNHYFFKSAEEYMWKFSRNRGGSSATAAEVSVGLTARFLDAFLQQLHEQRTTLETPLLSSSEAVASEMASLLALPEVAAALGVVQERYRTRLDRVKEAFRRAPVIAEAGLRGEEFLALAGAS